MPRKDLEPFVPRNIAELFYLSVDKYADNSALAYRVGHHYESLTYKQLRDEVTVLALALKKLGIKSGDRAILISENRPEWVISDLALSSIGAIGAPLHNVLSATQLSDVIEELSPKAIFFSGEETEEKMISISGQIAKIPLLISFEKKDTETLGKLHYFKELIDNHEATEGEKQEIVEASRNIDPSSVCTIIYTSGTTGHLKGVQLTHANLIANIDGCRGNIWSDESDKFFSILPLSHVFERTAGYYIPLYFGSSIGYSLNVANAAAEIIERQPTIIVAVPRLFEKIYEKVLERVNKNLFSKLIFRLSFGRRQAGKKDDFLDKVYDKIVFSKIRDSFGGQIKFFVSGGAKLPEKLGKFFDTVGLTILEGYGLTETSPVIAVNEMSAYKFGSVGHALSNVKVKIGVGDEVLVKGPSVMKGYLREEDNKEAFTKDSWFKTGDMGFVDKSGFLTITGRIKDLIVLTTGKKIAPVPIEEALELSEYIEQACVLGDGYKHIVALIVPNFEALKEEFGISERERLLKDEAILNLLESEIKLATRNMASIEQVRKYLLLKDQFSVESGEMTPTFKLRRHNVLARNLEVIENIYR